MFNNYAELYRGYVEFYRSSIYDVKFTNELADYRHTSDLIVPHDLRTLSQVAFQKGPPSSYKLTLMSSNRTCFGPSQQVGHLSSSTELERTATTAATTTTTTTATTTTTTTTTTITSTTTSNCSTPISWLRMATTNHSAPLGQQHVSVPEADGQTTVVGLLSKSGGKLVRVGEFNALEWVDLAHVCTILIVMMLAKRFLARKIRSCKQINQLGLRQKDRERLDECIWRLIYYSFSSSWLIYSCLQHDSLQLLTPTTSFIYSFETHWSSYAIFMIEAGFYLHATYALVYEDVWRRDSFMMLIHHLAAVFATLALYATRTHQIGLVSTVLRDTCDVLLELTKLVKCFHIQHGKRIKRLGHIVNCLLATFALAFAINQLYYFPLFCLYHGLNLTKLYNIQTPTMTAILTCGLIFLLLDILWFGLILRLIYFMMFSARPLKDLREYDDEDEDVVNEPNSGAAHKQRID